MKSIGFRLMILMLLGSTCVHAQPKTDSELTSLLRASPSPVLHRVLNAPDSFRCQIMYTRIDRDEKGRPVFNNYYFNVDRNLYFNPASMMKLPLAALALEKLKKLKSAGIQLETVMAFDSSFAGQVPLYRDSTSDTGMPSLGQFIRKAFLISDNDAYNRMYQFVGQQQINRRLHQLGYKESRITRQFMGFSEEGNRHTNPVRYLDNDGAVILIQPPAYNRDSFSFPLPVLVGNGYRDLRDSLVLQPFDFTRHNSIPLQDLHRMLQSILFPSTVKRKSRFVIDESDRKFMLQYLSQYPSETSYPKYDESLFYNSYVKFFFRDSTHQMPAGVRVFNKVGWAYGFLTDVSYVSDTLHHVEFMLAATIYVNSDGILNDDHYEYEEIGYPFLRAAGEAIYKHELDRNRPARSMIPSMGIRYGTRNRTDSRPAIREVDN